MRTKILAFWLIFFAVPTAWTQDAKPQSEPPASTTSISDVEVPKITPERGMSFWMAKKLDYSKAILEALTMGDFPRLEKDAERLRVIGKFYGVVKSKNEDFRLQMSTFDLATRELLSTSKRRSAEGASLAFNRLTNSCVSCHELLRKGVK